MTKIRKSFNSLSRDHRNRKGIRTNRRRVSFNSLSRDHSNPVPFCGATVLLKLSTPSLGITIHFEDDIYNFCYAIFQLPLSGSHATVPSRPSDRSLGLFQLPLSGSLGSGDVARQIIRRLLLSTPSLGITWWQQSSSG